MNTQDIVIGERVVALFKGDPCTGKTPAAASYPDPYFFDFDGKMTSVKKMFPTKPVVYDRYFSFEPAYRRLKDWVEPCLVEEWVEGQKVVRVDPVAFSQRCPYKTLVLDSITSFSGAIISNQVNERPKKTVRGGISTVEIQDYGDEARGITMFLDALCIVPVNVIVIAHVLKATISELQGGRRVTTETRTLLTAGQKIAAVIPKYFQEIYHFYCDTPMGAVGDDVRPAFKICTFNTGTDFATSALPLPGTIDFTNKSLYSEIQRYVEADKMVVRI